MVTFTSNFEVMSRVGTPQNETFRGWFETQRRDTALVKIIDSKTIKPFDKKGNQPAELHQPAELSTTVVLRNVLKLF